MAVTQPAKYLVINRLFFMLRRIVGESSEWCPWLTEGCLVAIDRSRQ